MSAPADSALSVDLSIVIPVMNEEDSLRQLADEIRECAGAAVGRFEVCFVDDGSTDRSWEVISELQNADSRFFGIRFRRNFGKAAGLMAGMSAVSGRIVMMMDADLQDDPAEIPKMLARIEAGADVINGWKQKRLDPWHKVYPSRVFNAMVSKLCGLDLHDHNCGLKMFRREVTEELEIYGELHRFIAVLAHSRGYRVEEMVVHHRERQHGESKYGIRRFLRGLLDMLTVAFLISFGRRPQHALGGIGFGFFGLGALGMLWISFLWIAMRVVPGMNVTPVGNRPLLAYSVAAMLLGSQMLSLGLLAELIVSVTTRREKNFSIRETVGGTEAAESA